MRTKPNYKGESFEVTFDKVFEVRRNYTFKFILKRAEDVDVEIMKRFCTDIHIQIANVGCVVLFTNMPRAERYAIIPYISNAPLLDKVYRMIENGEKSISDFPKGYDLGTPTVNFGVLRTYTNEYDYVSGSIKVSRNDGNSFTLEFNDYVAAKQSGAKITIRGNLYVEKMKYF